MLNKNIYNCLKQYNAGYENTKMHQAIVYFESGTQASDMVDMSQFHKMSIYKMQSQRTHTNIISFAGSDDTSTPNH